MKLRQMNDNGEGGFTLIEVLAAIVILSVVTLGLTAFFTNAMSYSKSNQNKTIMVNLARNALFYMEKQDFDELEKYYVDDQLSVINMDEVKRCESQGAGCGYQPFFSGQSALEAILQPTVNGVEYTIDVTFQQDLYDEMTDPGSDKAGWAAYLLPVLVKVSLLTDSGGPSNPVVVEGYIADESIR